MLQPMMPPPMITIRACDGVLVSVLMAWSGLHSGVGRVVERLQRDVGGDSIAAHLQLVACRW